MIITGRGGRSDSIKGSRAAEQPSGGAEKGSGRAGERERKRARGKEGDYVTFLAMKLLGN
jgi:hypothetical protein